jgi:hypothetical protein
MSKVLIEVHGVSKAFGGVVANHDVSLRVEERQSVESTPSACAVRKMRPPATQGEEFPAANSRRQSRLALGSSCAG